jgi:hypothetical protein
MKKNNNNVFKGLALAVGAGLVVNELTKDSAPRSANLPTTKENTLSIDQIIERIKAEPEIVQFLKGTKGDKGDLGATGATGLAGNQIVNFRNSLLKNGNGELNSSEFWSGVSFNSTDGIYSIDSANAYNITKIKTSKKRLFKVDIDLTVLGDGYINIYTDSYSYTNVNLGPNNFNNIYALTNQNSIYVFDSKNGSSYIILHFQKVGTIAAAFFENLCFKEVSLGEAVPSNLPWLPTGQEVKNPTNGWRGYYNGTSIYWYLMNG